jgi:biopolymer transport protein ExbD
MLIRDCSALFDQRNGDFLIVRELGKKVSMLNKAKHRTAEPTTSSMADIAFLMLTFFLMTAMITKDEGLTLTLPEYRQDQVIYPVPERNLFKIQINSKDEIMVEGERIPALTNLGVRIKEFILNNGKDGELSDTPEKAIVSLKTDRGTTHKVFVSALDEIQGAYYQIYASRVGLSVAAFRKLDSKNPVDKRIIEKAKDSIPMNISLAEPSQVNHKLK